MCDRTSAHHHRRLGRALQVTAVGRLTQTEMAVWSRWFKWTPVIDVIHMRIRNGGHLGLVAGCGSELPRTRKGGAQ